MIEIREVLRAWLAGKSERAVAAQGGVDRKTSRRYVRAAVTSGLSRGGGEGQLTDELIGQVVSVVRPVRPDGHGQGLGGAGGPPRADRERGDFQRRPSRRNNGMISGTQITPLQRADIPELSQFLISGLGDPATSYLFSHEVLLWKYFDGPSGPSGDSVCSLIAHSAGRIIGHIGMCPRQFIVSGDGATPVSTMHAIDWLGSAAHPGLGALLMLQAFATSKTQYAVGGTAQSQAIFPRLGFEQKPKLAIFHKVLAPFHRLRTTDQGLFRKWAGTAKDMASVWRAPHRRCRRPSNCARHLRSPKKLIAYNDSLHCQL